MFRAILELIAVVLIITVLRSVIGIISKVFGNMARPSSQASPGPSPHVSAGGELKKDPVCGTFIAADSALQKRVGGEIYYFCSTTCRDKFSG